MDKSRAAGLLWVQCCWAALQCECQGNGVLTPLPLGRGCRGKDGLSWLSVSGSPAPVHRRWFFTSLLCADDEILISCVWSSALLFVQVLGNGDHVSSRLLCSCLTRGSQGGVVAVVLSCSAKRLLGYVLSVFGILLALQGWEVCGVRAGVAGALHLCPCSWIPVEGEVAGTGQCCIQLCSTTELCTLFFSARNSNDEPSVKREICKVHIY